MDRLVLMLKQAPKEVKGKIVAPHITLDIVEAERHYWSPQLSFRVEQAEGNEAHAVLLGLVGPRPEVWTMFMFVYFVIGILGFFVFSYGVAQYMLGKYSSFLLAFPATIILLLTAYGVSKYGERLAADQIDILKQFVRDAISFK